MKNCDKYKMMMSEAVDGRLKGKQLDEFHKHIDTCPECLAEFESLKSLISQMNTLPEIDLPEGFHERAMNRVRLEANNNTKKSIFEIISDLISNLSNKRLIPAMTSAFVCFILLGSAISVLNNVNLSSALDEGGIAQPMAMQAPASAGVPMVEAPTAVAAAGASAETFSEAAVPMAETTMAAPTASASIVEAPTADSSVELFSGQAGAETGAGEASAKTILGDTVQIESAEAENAAEPQLRINYIAPAGAAVPESDGLSEIRMPRGGISSEHASLTTKTVSIRIEVEDARETVSLLRQAGWDIETSTVRDDRAYMTLKVVNYDVDYAVDALKGMGKVLSETEHMSDLTDNTNDYAIRYEARVIEAERLYSLMERAESIEDIVKLEERLSGVINHQQASMGSYNVNIDTGSHCQVHVEIISTVKYEEIRPKTFTERLKEGFIGSVNFTTGFFENTAVVASALVLPCIIVIILVVVIRFLGRKSSKGGGR